jgi:hypothetical protein
MEVHHHSHTSRKKWIHYFWEFLMLFLAVFCGFLAEYQLEHKIEKDREKVYITNLYEDLKSDTAAFAVFQRDNQIFSKQVDSIILLFKHPDRQNYLGRLYYLARIITKGHTGFLLYVNDRTFTQMKNSGLLRLIHKRRIADKISSYYHRLDYLDVLNDATTFRIQNYMETMAFLFQGDKLYKIYQEEQEPALIGLQLLSTDPADINKLIVSLQYFYGTAYSKILFANDRRTEAVELIELIKVDYKLK